MARDPKIRISEKPWLHGASRWWCATIGGKRKKLDKDFVAACRKLKALRVQAKKGLVHNRDWWDAPFSQLADQYLDDTKARKEPATYRSFRTEFPGVEDRGNNGPRRRTSEVPSGKNRPTNAEG